MNRLMVTLSCFALLCAYPVHAAAATFTIDLHAKPLAVDGVPGDEIHESASDLSVRIPNSGRVVLLSAGMHQLEVRNDGTTIWASSSATPLRVDLSRSARGTSDRDGSVTPNATDITGDCTTYGGYPSSRWNGNFVFRINLSGKPGGLTAAGFENNAISALSNLTTENNNCGRPDNVSISSSRGANVSSGPQVTVNGSGKWSCSTGDGVNQVGFRYAYGETQANGATCKWFSLAGWIIESDIAINTYQRIANAVPGNCFTNPYYLTEDILTHEFGHALGMEHSSSSPQYDSLTMYPEEAPCSLANTNLALGDMDSIEQIY